MDEEKKTNENTYGWCLLPGHFAAVGLDRPRGVALQRDRVCTYFWHFAHCKGFVLYSYSLVNQYSPIIFINADIRSLWKVKTYVFAPWPRDFT